MRSSVLDGAADIAKEEDDGALPWVQKEEKLSWMESQHFAAQLVQIFWRLLLARPQNVALAPVGLPGLTCVEATVQVRMARRDGMRISRTMKLRCSLRGLYDLLPSAPFSFF